MSELHSTSADAYFVMEQLCENVTSLFTQKASAGSRVFGSLVFNRFFNLTNAGLDHDEQVLFSLSIGVLVCWIVTVVLSSVLPSLKIDVLSLKQSWKELTTSRDSRLDILDVFRVFAIVWVVVNHLGSEGRIDILEGLPTSKEFKDAVHNHPIFGAFLGNSALGVEIFLVLSGLLAARGWHSQSQLPFAKHTKRFLIKRVFRLLPIVAVFIFIATGPIMKYMLPRFHNTMVANCGVRGIISHLTMTSNWQSAPTCMGYMWYMGLDMQLYLLAPILLHLLYRHTKFAVALIAFLSTCSALLRALSCRAYNVCNKSDVDIPFIYVPSMSAEEIKQVYAGLWEMYARPCTKCAPFLIGLLLGFVISNIKLKLDMPTVRQTFFSALACCIGVIYGILPEYWFPEQGNTLYNTLYTALFRTVFAGAIAIMIGSLFYSVQRTQVSHLWAVLAKLSFNVYLLHMPVVYIFNHVNYLQTTTSAYALVLLLPFACVLSFGVAFLFYMFFEAPISRLSSKLLGKLL